MSVDTFHSCRLVNEEISVPDDGEIHRQITGLVSFVPVLQTQTQSDGVCLFLFSDSTL